MWRGVPPPGARVVPPQSTDQMGPKAYAGFYPTPQEVQMALGAAPMGQQCGGGVPGVGPRMFQGNPGDPGAWGRQGGLDGGGGAGSPFRPGSFGVGTGGLFDTVVAWSRCACGRVQAGPGHSAVAQAVALRVVLLVVVVARAATPQVDQAARFHRVARGARVVQVDHPRVQVYRGSTTGSLQRCRARGGCRLLQGPRVRVYACAAGCGSCSFGFE
jgi:hypothetical protein